MNINNLQIQLQEAVNNAAAEATTDGTSSTLYYLQLAKAVQQLNMGQIRTVATVASLPAAASNTGLLVFVTAEERLYFSDGTAWATIVPPIVYNNSAWSWGQNTFISAYGTLGDGTTVNKQSPVSVVGGFTDWCQVSMSRHSLAVRTNGTAWGWGRANYGILGNNCTTNRSSPVSVVGGFTDWCQVATGQNHSLGVRQNGTAWGWGVRDNGQIGDNQTAVDRSSPVSVVGGFTNWCQIAAGQNFSLGVRTNGTAWSWGRGTGGALGDNSTADKSSPVSVVGGFTDWCQVSGGYKHSLGVRQNGTVWAWGYNASGQLGTNTAGGGTSTSSPVSVVGGFTDWCQASAGYQHSLGVRTNGTAWAWGNNCYGRLGDNTTVAKSSPVSVIGGFTNWCQVSGGYRHSAGVRQSGTAWGWGNGTSGQLGDNTTENRSSPVSVVGGFCDWCQISAASKGGGKSTLAIRSTPT
jgi:alpha-tubulin suppressor-like RCC1 family protein